MEQRTEDEKRKNTLDWNDINATNPATSFGVPVQNNSFGVNGQNGQSGQVGQSEAGLLNVKPAEEPEPPLPNAYDELLNTYKSRLEQEEKMGKARRGRAAINGIADMGRAIANLIATSQYAPNAYDPSQSLSASAQARYEKAKAERDKSRAEWMNYALTKKKLVDDVRNREYLKEKDKADREYKEKVLDNNQRRTDLMEQAEERRMYKIELDEAYRNGKLDLEKEKTETDRKYKEGMLSVNQYKARTAELNARLKEQGSTTETTEESIDPVTGLPKKKTVKKTTKPAGNKPKINY